MVKGKLVDLFKKIVVLHFSPSQGSYRPIK